MHLFGDAVASTLCCGIGYKLTSIGENLFPVFRTKSPIGPMVLSRGAPEIIISCKTRDIHTHLNGTTAPIEQVVFRKRFLLPRGVVGSYFREEK